MSSGFVSGGTVDAPIERDDAWLSAQKEIEANRQRKLDEQARQSDGRSLYETLEANKAAKQDAFEEANRLKNQFRALDEDEIDFLDSVMESTRAEEDRVRKETKEGLALFRQQQEEADKKARLEGKGAAGVVVEEGSPTAGAEEESWVAGGRKRKRAKDKEVIKGVKIRRSSTADEKTKAVQSTPPVKPKESASVESSASLPMPKKTPAPTVTAPAKTPSPPSKPSLVAYGSDSEED